MLVAVAAGWKAVSSALAKTSGYPLLTLPPWQRELFSGAACPRRCSGLRMAPGSAGPPGRRLMHDGHAQAPCQSNVARNALSEVNAPLRSVLRSCCPVAPRLHALGCLGPAYLIVPLRTRGRCTRPLASSCSPALQVTLECRQGASQQAFHGAFAFLLSTWPISAFVMPSAYFSKIRCWRSGGSRATASCTA